MGENFAGLDLWLITVPGHCMITASQDAIKRGLATPVGERGTHTLADGGSLAYLMARMRQRPVGDEGAVVEFGACGHGPRGAELAERLAGHIQAWDRDHRTGPGPALTVHPAGTPADHLPSGYVLNKRHSTIVLSWLEPAR
jgi:protein-L-isoaspartate(D-aspartate) O-methyltransferase